MTGFHAGADVAFYFSNRVGIGGMVWFSRGSVDLGSPDGGVVATDAGSVERRPGEPVERAAAGAPRRAGHDQAAGGGGAAGVDVLPYVALLKQVWVG